MVSGKCLIAIRYIASVLLAVNVMRRNHTKSFLQSFLKINYLIAAVAKFNLKTRCHIEARLQSKFLNVQWLQWNKSAWWAFLNSSRVPSRVSYIDLIITVVAFVTLNRMCDTRMSSWRNNRLKFVTTLHNLYHRTIATRKWNQLLL